MQAVLAILLAAVLLVVACLIGTATGAVIGAIVGWAFPGTLATLSTALLGSVVPAWQLGASLGFVGGFFRSSTTSSS